LFVGGTPPDEYCTFNISYKYEDFNTDVSNKNIYLLFNVNNSDTDIAITGNVAGGIYEKYFKSLEYSVGDTSLQNLTYGYLDWLGDFSLSRITTIFTPGFAPIVQSTRKNIMGTCINIDCTNIADLCADLQGC
jgi:hypothetical protein